MTPDPESFTIRIEPVAGHPGKVWAWIDAPDGLVAGDIGDCALSAFSGALVLARRRDWRPELEPSRELLDRLRGSATAAPRSGAQVFQFPRGAR